MELTLEITQKCLKRCIYCSSCSTAESDVQLSYRDCLQALHDGKKIEVNEVNISGGEPFLHKDIMGIIWACKDLGYKVNIYTSGLCLDNKGNKQSIPEEYVYGCKLAGVSKVIFNMQACEDVKEQEVAGVDTGDMKLRDMSVSRFVASGITTEVNIVPMKINIGELDNIVTRAFNLGCSRVNMLGLVVQGRAVGNRDKLVIDSAENYLLKQEIRQLKNKYGKSKLRVGSPLSDEPSEKCYAGTGKLVIRYDGYVFPCEAFKHQVGVVSSKGEYQVMTIKEHGLKNIVEQSMYLRGVKEYIDSCKKADCKDCPAQQELGMNCAFDKERIGTLPAYIRYDKEHECIREEEKEEMLHVDSGNIRNVKVERYDRHYENWDTIKEIAKYHGVSNIDEKDEIVVCKTTKGKMIEITQLVKHVSKEDFTRLKRGEVCGKDTKSVEDNKYNVIYQHRIYKKECKEAKFLEYERELQRKCLSHVKELSESTREYIAITSNERFIEVLLEEGFREIGAVKDNRVFGYKIAGMLSRENMLKE